MNNDSNKIDYSNIDNNDNNNSVFVESSNKLTDLLSCVFGIILSIVSFKLAIFDITKILSIVMICIFVLKVLLRKNLKAKKPKTVWNAFLIIMLALTSSVWGPLVFFVFLILFANYNSSSVLLSLYFLIFILLIIFSDTIKGKFIDNKEFVKFSLIFSILVCGLTILNQLVLNYFI